MSIQLNQLFLETAEFYELKLLAGKNGLNRELTWVQFCEDIANANFFRGNELAITTGLCFNEKSWLKNFITELIRCHSCGLIINIGKYVHTNDITQDIIQLCDNKNFPLFTMPWKIHLADITQDYYNRLFSAQQKETNLTELIRTAIFEPEKAADIKRDFALQGLSNMTCYLSVIEPATAPLTENNERALLLHSKTILNQSNLAYAIFWHHGQLLQLLFTDNQALLLNTITAVLELYKKLLPKDMPTCGTSSLQTNPQQFTAAYHEACAAAAVARLQQKPCMAFDTLGIYRLLFTANNHQLLKKMCDELLQPLISYDEKHHTQLAHTLRLYLFHNSSLQATAKIAFTHRNTINYRISKVRDILQCDLDDAVIRFNLILAFYITDYLRIAVE